MIITQNFAYTKQIELYEMNEIFILDWREIEYKAQTQWPKVKTHFSVGTFIVVFTHWDKFVFITESQLNTRQTGNARAALPTL